MTSSSTTARTRREAFSRGDGDPKGCSLGLFGLLASHNARARGWRHRLDRLEGLEGERSRRQLLEPVVGSVVVGYSRQDPCVPGLRQAGGRGALSPGVPRQVHGESGGSGESLGSPRLQPGAKGGQGSGE